MSAKLSPWHSTEPKRNQVGPLSDLAKRYPVNLVSSLDMLRLLYVIDLLQNSHVS